MNAHPEIVPTLVDRIKQTLVGLKMPRAIEILDVTGEQAQVDLARFEVKFTDERGVTRIVWLFSMVLGYSRLIWARFAFTRICSRFCAATSPRSRRSVERHARFSTTA